MTWVATAIAGSAVLGYLGSQNQADAATQSAQLQSQAAERAAAQQMEQFNMVSRCNTMHRAILQRRLPAAVTLPSRLRLRI